MDKSPPPDLPFAFEPRASIPRACKGGASSARATPSRPAAPAKPLPHVLKIYSSSPCGSSSTVRSGGSSSTVRSDDAAAALVALAGGNVLKKDEDMIKEAVASKIAQTEAQMRQWREAKSDCSQNARDTDQVDSIQLVQPVNQPLPLVEQSNVAPFARNLANQSGADSTASLPRAPTILAPTVTRHPVILSSPSPPPPSSSSSSSSPLSTSNRPLAPTGRVPPPPSSSSSSSSPLSTSNRPLAPTGRASPAPAKRSIVNSSAPDDSTVRQNRLKRAHYEVLAMDAATTAAAGGFAFGLSDADSVIVMPRRKKYCYDTLILDPEFWEDNIAFFKKKVALMESVAKVLHDMPTCGNPSVEEAYRDYKSLCTGWIWTPAKQQQGSFRF